MIRSDRNDERACSRTIGVLLLTLVLSSLAAAPASAQGTCPGSLATADIIDHDFDISFCELCDVGTVRIVIENPFRSQDDVDFSEIVIREDLRSSGLTYVPGSTRFSAANITPPPSVEPAVAGPDGSQLTWTLSSSFGMPGQSSNSGNGSATLVLEFDVRRHSNVGDEGLVQANRTIDAAVDVTPSCAPATRHSRSTGPGSLPLREPVPQIIKRGRNLDAGQGTNNYSDPVFGHANDDVIWRIEVRNNGLADLQDFVFSDSIVPGNFEIHHVCANEGDATAAGNGASPAGCRAVGNTTDVIALDVADEFGGGANPYIVAPAGGSGFYYLVGTITDSCTNRRNTVFDVEWGCQAESPVGGISVTSAGASAGDSALLSTQSVESGVQVNVSLTGANTSQPMGSKGTVTIRIVNNSGGTIKGDADGIAVRDLLPTEYVVDPSAPPSVSMAPAYANAYPGMIDTLTWTNPEPGTLPFTATDPARPLANTDLSFELTSSSPHPEFPEQEHMVRHGDAVTITIPVVLIDPQYYDKVADLDVRREAPNSDPPGTDPTASFPVSNRAEIWFDEFCTNTEHHLTIDDTDEARPEDLDVDIIGSELVFILTNTGDPLPLTVALENAGGHDADDYEAYVTFGEAMVVQTAPSGCAPTTNPPPLPVWQIPTPLPASASVYRCDRGTIGPGHTRLLEFEVVKNTASSFDDDLTFRVDVIGEITLRDGTPLWFPPPTARPDGITDRANDYSLDAVRARVVGYNLFKEQLGICTENNPPPGAPDAEIQIGEECSFHVESGGWFGFQTPGFTYIAVQNIQVVDQTPDGQGYISSTDPFAESTSAIRGVALNPPPAALTEDDFDWTFNRVVPGERITEKDHWFRVNVTTRLLNDPLDASAPPNEHAAISTNILTSTFEAIFHNPVSNEEELYTLGPNTVGFPREVHRRVDLTVTEPLLSVTKEVCNEVRYGAGPACSNFVPLADDGDAFDTYIYRVTVANEASDAGVTRAPAYDVTVTTVTDPSDQIFVDPLSGDALDNDGDALVDGGDAGGEGTITDSVLLNGTPAEIIESYTHSDALKRIDAGASVVFYYRVDPDDDVAPLQRLTNQVTASYDSLEGASGAQTPPQGSNGEVGGARQYVSEPAEATIQIIPVEVDPKAVVQLSSTALGGNPQPVSIGEEIEFQLRTLIPVAQLRGFTIRDELPAGLRCTDAPAVNLDAAPYAAAGFMPGGTITPTCTDTEVVWDFGDQTVTQSPRDDRRFDFAIRFIARVDNNAANQEGLVIRNGGDATVTTVRYVDEAGNEVVLTIGEAAVVVREPALELTKAFSVAEVDAGDLPRVVVTATNTGTATAFNPRVFDDLAAVGLEFAGDVQGTDPPSADLAAFGANQPLFQWPSGFGVTPGASVSFSFAVRVDAEIQPLDIIPNTIEADWTSLPSRATALNASGQIGPDGSETGMRTGTLPNAADPLNDYEAQASASVTVAAVALAKTDLDVVLPAEIGAHKPFETSITLPEGATEELVITDQLDAGAVGYVFASNAAFPVSYEFIGIRSINGQPPAATAFTALPADGASGSAVWTIGRVVTDAEDDLATQDLTPTIRIRYFARINNDLATNVGSTLQNAVQLSHRNGETGDPATVDAATAPITAIESNLNASKALTNVTPGKAPGDPGAFDDVLQYVVTVANAGNALAHDLNVVDTLPPELALYAGFTPTAAIDGTPVAGFVASPAGAPDGPLVWGRENGDASLDIPPAGALELTYQVIVRAPPAPGQVLENIVWTDWTSLDGAGVDERTGAGCPSITPPDDYCFGPARAAGATDPFPPPELAKQNTQASAAIGEAFEYLVTVPATPYAFPLYDVKISDDLSAAAADLRFLGVRKISGSGAWTPSNTGDATNVVIEDAGGGIDIPTGEQIVIALRVVLEDTPTNASGSTFTNTASHVYNATDDDPASERNGASGTTDPMTIVGPDALTLEKSGPAQMTIGVPAAFTLDVHNTGNGTAWHTTITDRLPNSPTAGTCDTAPTQFTVQIFQGNGTTPVSGLLVEGSDYRVDFLGEPDCEFQLAMLSAAGAIGADQRLIVGYRAALDADSQDASALTNVAGATEWFGTEGADPETAGDRRTYTRGLSNGTVNDLDHEDAHTLVVALPQLRFEKTVSNLTSGVAPAATANPGDRLRYELQIENLGSVAIDEFAIVDELDRLNAPAVFEAGTLALTTTPADADVANTNASGGASGTGLLDVRNLSLGANESVVIAFEITLAPVVANGMLALNQAQLRIDGIDFAQSDDPNLNGAADPGVAGDEDPTQLLIESAPAFRVEKTSAYLTGDPNLLLAGETLRYTITVKNIGTDHASDAMLRDAIPVNTQYVPDSTTLNGAPVPDGASGTAPLASGIAIQAPEDPTPGALRADASPTTGNVATLVFDVIVDPNVIDGTVISNQAFVSALQGGVSDQPSDDPRTPLADDPTRDVVGNAPLLFAAKSARLEVDAGTPGLVDPGDVLRYTISVQNSGAVDATNAVLRDAVPANTSYVADSTTQNGMPVAQPDGGVSPLVAGLPISSADRTPPLPGAGEGTLSPGQAAVIEFQLRVDAGVPSGTVISNQAVVTSDETPDLLTDGDGNPATGPEPTRVVVGDGQQLTISKQVAVVGGGAAMAGGELEYTVQVQNIASVAASSVVVTDDLDAPTPGQLAYVAGSATLNGAAAGVTVVGSMITADYSSTYGPLAPGATLVLRFRAVIDSGLAMGTTITNTGVVTWNTPAQTASASVSVDVGGMPGFGALNGSLWHDSDFDLAIGGSERLLEGWTVELLRNDQPLQSVSTDASGTYRIAGLMPNDTSGDRYALRFRAPDAGANAAALGQARSAFTNDMHEIRDIVVASGSNLEGLDLPIQPNGVVYDSVLRAPLAGATLTLQNAGSGASLPSSCFDDPLQQGQVTGRDGYYKFDLNFSSGSCPSGANYVIAVAEPGTGFVAGASQIIPPTSDASGTAFNVPQCPGDAVAATAQHCEAQASEFPPPTSVPPRSAATGYHTYLTLDATQAPGSSQLFNNHIPLDPVLDGAVSITKTTPSLNVRIGDLVPYEITVTNQLGVAFPDLSLSDRFPAGFRYIEGSARVDGVALEPTRDGRHLQWSDIGVDASSRRTVVLLLAVGAGVSEGEYVNRAQATSSLTGTALSGEATSTVRVVPDPDFACTDVFGKVFDDADRNGSQDGGERGLAGVRLVTARGLVATTDPHGRFHITCAVTPREDRGSNFVLKLDDRSLPSGYRMSTPQVQVKRATRGKALRFNYGASVHRVVGLDLADAVFEPGSAAIRPQWKSRIPRLLEELAKAPATLRLAYVADLEDAALVDTRLAAVEREIAAAWQARGGAELTVEPEVFWRRGGPAGATAPRVLDGRWWSSLFSSFASAPATRHAASGAAVERHQSLEQPTAQWAHDPELLATEFGDRLEQREVPSERVETVKLADVVPAIRFESGIANIPPSTIAKLREVLEGMRHLRNVRLHLIGHADDQPLSGALSGVFGDNTGLSRERAGEVAEFIQTALALPPEAISFAWAGDDRPIASNATAQGRALNRRVEVEVWYDQIEQETELREVVVPEDIKRVKVCRTETVCKLRYREGHAHRARVKNLIAPLRFDDETVALPENFVREVAEALQNLSSRENVTVKFTGFTDDVPLTGRAERIYGTHLALSKARAHRVALALQEALGLPSAAVASDGRGASRPLASNESERGRALNRRIEVEFWHDDPLQELPDDPQPCPDPADAELVTKVYDPPWGRIEALPIEQGEAKIPSGYGELLRRAMADVAGEQNVRLRFVGYTANERLERRTALVYGDDIGLSAARARRTMETLRERLGLDAGQAEHEGRGYVHSNDVVNAGFLQGMEAHVVVQVVYDEPAVVDDYDGVDVTRITRELRAQNPLALNLMHISVDGEPLDDPGRSSADIQRCTDVALERTDIGFRFDNLRLSPRLSVVSRPASIETPARGGAATLEAALLVPLPGEETPALDGEATREAGAASAVEFRMYTNYAHFLERAEVRIFEQAQSLQAEPLALVEVGDDGIARWRPAAETASFTGPVRELKYVLRAYDPEGRFDETAAQPLWIVRGGAGAPFGMRIGSRVEGEGASREPEDPSLVGYGESGALLRNIPLGSAGTVMVQGRGVPAEHTVLLAGAPVPVDAEGNFAAEVVLPSGMHTVEVAVLDEEGNGELFLRDLGFARSDWFYMGLADVTVGSKNGGAARELQGANAPFDRGSMVDGRLAFYVNGKFGDDWKLTASADTREGPVEDLFSNFMDKSPESLFRRLDADLHYPTFGDDGTVEETAPTNGKLYFKLSQRENHALWGNFIVGYRDNELALVERGLYGANLHYQSLATTRHGEPRFALDGFAAEPGTVSSREEFRGTGGSLYFLRRQDLLIGSDRLRVEVRDKVSGLVRSVSYLESSVDYDVDYLQGRILLAEPIAATVGDDLLVRNGGLSGDEAWLVVQYEYTPGFDEIDTLATGGQGHAWIGDFLKVGATASHNDEGDTDSSLYAGDLTARVSTESWLKVQASRSEGLVSTSLRSDDGGFRFLGLPTAGLQEAEANGYRGDLSIGFSDLVEVARGRLSVYFQRLEAGYSAPGLTALTDTQQAGGQLSVPLTDRLEFSAKADWVQQDAGLETTVVEGDVEYRFTEHWSLSTGVRHDRRKDDAPVVPLTQEEGERTDAVVQLAYDSLGRWLGYAFGQATLANEGDREANNRGGVGGAYRLNDRLVVDGEVSYGDLGPAVKVGTRFQESEHTYRYFSYGLNNELAENGLHERRGNLVSGMRTRLSDSSSVYLEDRYQHTDSTSGLSRSIGVTLAPAERWSVGANWEFGTLIDQRTNAETRRNAGGARVAYGSDTLQVSSAIEYRFDETEQPDRSWSDRTTWLFRNNLKFQMSDDWRVLGKYNHSFSDSSLGQFFDGGYREAVLGFAYRPVKHDRLNALAKYTYFYNVPTTDQVDPQGGASQFIQTSHVVAFDLGYDLTSWLSLGGKYAYRLGQVSLDRENEQFFDNDAHLAILRSDVRFRKHWETTAELRMLALPDLDEQRSGALLTVNRYLGEHFKVGVGYNFTDFSEDLTDLSYDHHGWFLNVVGSF